MMHSGELPVESVTQLTSLKRHLFCRVCRETENLKAFNEVSENEHNSDSLMGLTFRVRDHIQEVMIPALLAGKFPKLNSKYDALPQYEDCWEVCSLRKQGGVSVLRSFHVDSFFFFSGSQGCAEWVP